MSLGITEITLILVVILLLFGGKRIPELARALGKASYEFKKAKEVIKKETDELKESLEDSSKNQQITRKYKMQTNNDNESLISHLEALRETLLKCFISLGVNITVHIFNCS